MFLALVAPESYDDLKDLLHGHTPDNQRLIVARTQKCNHPSLAVGNKLKLQVQSGTVSMFLYIYVARLSCLYGSMNTQYHLCLSQKLFDFLLEYVGELATRRPPELTTVDKLIP